MQNLKTLETTVLVEMLALHTDEYTRMLNNGASDIDFSRCKITINLLQEEINSRNPSGSNTSITDPSINFTGSTE